MSKVEELENLYSKIDEENNNLKKLEYDLDLELENTEEQDLMRISDLREKISESYKNLGLLNDSFFDLEQEMNNKKKEKEFQEEIEHVKNVDIANGFSNF